MEKDLRICPVCEKEYERKDMNFSRDCQGIAYRLLCWNCLEEIYAKKGYDGEYYDERDEYLGDDY